MTRDEAFEIHSTLAAHITTTSTTCMHVCGACAMMSVLHVSFVSTHQLRTSHRATSSAQRQCIRQRQTCVQSTAAAAAVPESAEPPLSASHPTHRRAVPETAMGTLWVPRPLRLRWPMTAATIRAENPDAVHRARLPA
jgi:hypothetical protein